MAQPNPTNLTKQREQELTRIRSCIDLIFDGQKMLFCILTGDDPHEARKLPYQRFDEAGRTISPEYLESAKKLYRLAGSEFQREYSQRLCRIVEEYLSSVLTAAELREFKKRTPMKYPLRHFDSIFDELAADADERKGDNG